MQLRMQHAPAAPRCASVRRARPPCRCPAPSSIMRGIQAQGLNHQQMRSTALLHHNASCAGAHCFGPRSKSSALACRIASLLQHCCTASAVPGCTPAVALLARSALKRHLRKMMAAGAHSPASRTIRACWHAGQHALLTRYRLAVAAAAGEVQLTDSRSSRCAKHMRRRPPAPACGAARRHMSQNFKQLINQAAAAGCVVALLRGGVRGLLRPHLSLRSAGMAQSGGPAVHIADRFESQRRW